MQMRKLAVLVALPIAGALLGIGPAAAQPAPNTTAFCDAALTADKAANKVFGGGKPKQKDIQALDAALAQTVSASPSELTETLQAVIAGVQSAIQSGKDPTTDPEFQRTLNVIDEYRFNSCGYQTADVTTTEYDFVGLPKTFTPGPVAVKLTNTGAEIHEMAAIRLKTKDSVKKVLGLSAKDQQKRAENVGAAFVQQGETDFFILDFSKPGRYGVACFLPVGSTSQKEADKKSHEHGGGTPHWKKGMYASITVQAA
jgi:hypothetical protein